MPGGWDNEPEYGGPEPTWREAVVIALVILAIAGLIILALEWKHPLRLAEAMSPGSRPELTTSAAQP